MATLSQSGIPGSGNGILMPKIKNRFQVMFVGIAGTGTNLTRQVVTANRPQLEFEEIPLHRYNSVAFAAGKHMWTEFQCTIEDDLTGLASNVIQQQLEHILLDGKNLPILTNCLSFHSHLYSNIA